MAPRTLLVTALVLATASLSHGAPDKLPKWAPSVEAGLKEAKERGCALLVALNMDRERGNQQMVDEVYTDPVFHAATKTCVVAVASLGKHRTIDDPKSGRKVCERFGSVTCEEHQAIEAVMRTEWLKRGPDEDIESPRHFLLAPTGQILFQRTWTVEADELAALMRRATQMCEPGALEKWDTTEGRLERVTDTNSAVRLDAMRALIAENDPAIDKKILAKAKKAKDGDVRVDLITAFAGAEDPKRREIAYGFLKDKDPDVRLKAAYALELAKDANALKPLTTRLGKEKDEKVQAGLCRAIGVCGAGEDKARDLLVKFAKRKKFGQREHAVVALRAWARDKKVHTLVNALAFDEEQDYAVRSAAIWILGYGDHEELIRPIASVGRRERAYRRLAEGAADKLSGKDPRRYDDAPRWFARHPAKPREDWRGGGR